MRRALLGTWEMRVRQVRARAAQTFVVKVQVRGVITRLPFSLLFAMVGRL